MKAKLVAGAGIAVGTGEGFGNPFSSRRRCLFEVVGGTTGLSGGAAGAALSLLFLARLVSGFEVSKMDFKLAVAVTCGARWEFVFVLGATC